MKCAGAPLKHTFLLEDRARRESGSNGFEMHYLCPQNALFSVPIVAEKVRMLFGERGISSHFDHQLVALDPGRRLAYFSRPSLAQIKEAAPVASADSAWPQQSATGTDWIELPYDYIHVIPPQRAPKVVRESGLSWPDRWVGQGWVEVDPHTLRHVRYPEVFALGDVAGVPKGKTAASVKWQAPVVEDQLVAALQGRDSDAHYDGYTSCPLITRVGQATMVEFDYEDTLLPSFPGLIAPLEELWLRWLMKGRAVNASYQAMLRRKAQTARHKREGLKGRSGREGRGRCVRAETCVAEAGARLECGMDQRGGYSYSFGYSNRGC